MNHARAWGVALSLWTLMVLVTAYEIVPASILSVYIAELAIGKAAASWIVSVLLLAMSVAAIPAGLVVDRVNNRYAVVVGTVVVFLATIWGRGASIAGSYDMLLLSRFLGGMMVVVVWTAGVTHVGDVFPTDRQATPIGVLTTAVPAGFAVGQFTGPQIAALLGWTALFPVYGGLALLLSGVYWVLSRPFPDATTSRPTPTAADFSRVLADRRVWYVGVMGFVAFSVNLYFNSWMPTYLVERFSFSLALSGALAGVFPAVGVVARGASGPVSDRVFNGRRRPVILWSFVFSIPLIAVISFAGLVAVFMLALVIAGFVTQLGLALLFTYVRELVETNVAATALAVLNAIGFFGAFSSPIVTGPLIERTGSYGPAFGFALGLAVIGTLVAWRSPSKPRGT